MQSALPILSVRELQASDIRLIINYWTNAAPAYLQGMGVDLDKLPGAASWADMLQAQLHQDYRWKQSYCMIWLMDEKPIGHSNVNKIRFGELAFMHLHIWYAEVRRLGLGVEFIRLTLPHFFERLQLQRICCEPWALNPAPNRALSRAGFTLIDQYHCIPGSINTEQLVNCWEITKNAFEQQAGNI